MPKLGVIVFAVGMLATTVSASAQPAADARASGEAARSAGQMETRTAPANRGNPYDRLFEPRNLQLTPRPEVLPAKATVTCESTKVPLDPPLDVRIKKQLALQPTQHTIRGLGPICR